MKTATALLVHPTPMPSFGNAELIPNQVPLPLTYDDGPALLPPPDPRDKQPHDSLKLRAAQFMQVVVEALSGERSMKQLATLLAPEVYDQLQRKIAASSRGPERQRIKAGARIASVHVAMVNDQTAEISARMVQSGRSRALAIRLELKQARRGGARWFCTALTWA